MFLSGCKSATISARILQYGRVCVCENMPTKASRHMSKITAILDGEIPQVFNHIKELNRQNSRDLKKKYDVLLQRAIAGGGERGIERHVKRNKKMLIRDRIKLLLDENSERLELSPLAGLDMEYGDVPCAGVVSVIGKVHDIWCMIIANDATVKSGSIYPITLKKQLRAQNIAQENRLPTIYLVDSGGAFLPKQAEIFNDGGGVFYNEAIMSSAGIPQTAVVCGSCTAGAAYIPAMSDEAVILHRAGTIFLGGPPLVYAATGEKVTAEELGGATLHCKVSGCTDHFANTEQEALSLARDIIATLNLHNLKESTISYEEPLYSSSNLDDFAPCYEGCQVNPHAILASIVDGSRFHEFKGVYGTTLVTGFGYVKGYLCGFVASYGRLTGAAAMKGSHFVQLCSQRRIPLVFLQHFGKDAISSPNQQEYYNVNSANSSVVKNHAQLMQAVACSNVPSVAIATGGLIGSIESHALGSLSMGSRFQFIYPNVKVGADYPADIAHSAALDSLQHDTSYCGNLSSNFLKLKLQFYEKYKKETEAFHASAHVRNDGVILPRHTRDILGICLRIFKQEELYSSFKNSLDQPMIRM